MSIDFHDRALRQLRDGHRDWPSQTYISTVRLLVRLETTPMLLALDAFEVDRERDLPTRQGGTVGPTRVLAHETPDGSVIAIVWTEVGQDDVYVHRIERLR